MLALREKIWRFLVSKKMEIELPNLDDLSSVECSQISGTDDSSHNMSTDLDSSVDTMNMSLGSMDQSFDQSAYIEKLELENGSLKMANKKLKSKLKDSSALIGQLQDQVTQLTDDSADIAMPRFELEKEKGKYLNPKAVLLVMKLCARGISQDIAILAVKDMNEVLRFMDPKKLAESLPSRGGSTSKVITALAYINAATTHERLLKWNEWTAMADGTKIAGTDILAVNLHNNQTGEDLVSYCSQISNGTGVSIANKMMESVDHVANSGTTDQTEFLNKFCSNLSAVQTDGCASQIKANSEFVAQVTNVVKTTSQILNGVEMSNDQLHAFERSQIMVYCGLHAVKHLEDSIFSVLSDVSRNIITQLVTAIGVGGNRSNDPNSCFAEWNVWSNCNIPVERRYREVKNGKPIGRVQISGNSHSRIGVSGSTWRAILVQYNDVIDFFQQVRPLRQSKLIETLVQNKHIVLCELYAASTATGNFVYPLWRIINSPDIGMQEFLSFLRKSQDMLKNMADPEQSALAVIQSVASNPVFPFIPVTDSRDAAERIYNGLVSDDSSSCNTVTKSLQSMGELFFDLIEAKYANLLDSDNIGIIHDRVPRSNFRCESLLGIASSIHRKKGRQLPENRESLVIANANRTMEYMSHKPITWQLKLVKDAWRKAPQIASQQLVVREENRLALQQKVQQVIYFK